MAKPVRDSILTHYDFGLAGANNELFWDVIWLSMSKMFLIFHEGVLVGGLEHVLFFHILGIIIPTDFHSFQRGGSTTNQSI